MRNVEDKWHDITNGSPKSQGCSALTAGLGAGNLLLGDLQVLHYWSVKVTQNNRWVNPEDGNILQFLQSVQFSRKIHVPAAAKRQRPCATIAPGDG